MDIRDEIVEYLLNVANIHNPDENIRDETVEYLLNVVNIRNPHENIENEKNARNKRCQSDKIFK